MSFMSGYLIFGLLQEPNLPLYNFLYLAYTDYNILIQYTFIFFIVKHIHFICIFISFPLKLDELNN